MSKATRNFWTGVVLTGNFAGAVCLTLFAWLSAGWMTGKSAAIWTTREWAVAACQRALYWIVIAAVVGLVAAIINRLVLARLFPERRLLPWFIGGADGLFIALGGIIGSIQFFIQRPFM